MNRNRSLRDLYVAIAIIVLIIARAIGITAEWMGSVACIGLTLAVFDLYLDIENQFKYYQRFLMIRGVFIIVGIVLIIFLVLSLINNVVIPSVVTDELSLATLLVSLPRNLLLDIFEKLICGDLENE